MLEFVEDVGGYGALEAREEVLELAVGHARGGEFIGVSVRTAVGVHAPEDGVFRFFGDGEGVRHYECYDDEAVDFAEQFGLGVLV